MRCYLLYTQTNHQMLCPQRHTLISTFTLSSPFPLPVHPVLFSPPSVFNLPGKHNLRSRVCTDSKCDVCVYRVAQGDVWICDNADTLWERIEILP